MAVLLSHKKLPYHYSQAQALIDDFDLDRSGVKIYITLFSSFLRVFTVIRIRRNHRFRRISYINV